MYACIDVRKDDSFEKLCFASEEDAKRFQRFVRIYQKESGAGNGYGAYWIFDEDIGLYRTMPGSVVCRLEQERIDSMVESVRLTRAKKRGSTAKLEIMVGARDGAIRFELNESPLSAKPTKG